MSVTEINIFEKGIAPFKSDGGLKQIEYISN